MFREFCRAKIHRATITDADLNYEGSLTVDSDLLNAAGIMPFEKVHVLNINSGTRLETYAIAGKPGSGKVCLNGAAARLGQPGDRVIIISYALLAEGELDGFRPAIVHVDDRNRILSTT